MKRIAVLTLLFGFLSLIVPLKSHAADFYYIENGKCIKTTTQPTVQHWTTESDCVKELNGPTQSDSSTSPNEEPSYKINDINVFEQPELIRDMYKQPEKRIDGNTRSVWVTFTGLDPKKEYYVCSADDLHNARICRLGNSTKAKSNDKGEMTFNVCGAGKNNIKGVQVEAYKKPDQKGAKLAEKCDEKRDYFHEGQTYRLTVFDYYLDPDIKKEIDKGIPFGDLNVGKTVSAEFFVAHSYPLVKINSSNALKSEINVTMWGRRPGDGNDNNYQVVLEGTDHKYKKEQCYLLPKKDKYSNQTVGVNTQWVPIDLEPGHFDHIFDGTGFNVPRRAEDLGQLHTFGSTPEKKETGALGKGLYILKINERISDNRPLNFAETCEGGHTFMHIFFRVGDSPKATNGIEIVKVIYDPNDADGEDMQDTAPAPPPPCAKEALDKDTGMCTAFDVALLGRVRLEPLPFIKSVYTIVLSIAGLAAVVIIIRAGYKLMYSRGDKEMIADARSHITSAIIGLLFIIFAYVILSVIGVDILKIPGFSN